MSEERIYYWDNLKCLLIFLVVVGHFLIPVYHDSGRSVEAVYFFIYLFHMPAFVFVSGFFAKSYLKKDVPVVGKLMGFLLLYVIYKILIWGVAGVCTGTFPKFDLFEETGAPWYLFAMFAWYLMLPLMAKFKGIICISATIILGLYIGLEDRIGPLFCLSKIIIFLPFFMAGFYFSKDTIHRLTCVRNKIISAVLLIVIAIGVVVRMDWIISVEALLYANQPYRILSKLSSLEAIGARACLYLIGFVMVFAVLCLIPQRKLCISYIGSRTLSIFVLHRLIRDVFVDFEVFDRIGVKGIKLLLFCLAVSAVVTWISSAKIFHRICNSVFHINYKPILKNDEE